MCVDMSGIKQLHIDTKLHNEGFSKMDFVLAEVNYHSKLLPVDEFWCFTSQNHNMIKGSGNFDPIELFNVQ